MNKKIYYIFILLIFSFYLFAKDVPIQEIEKELTQAEIDFQIAKKMFNPWYGGPLLTGSGNVMPPGYVNINPQVQITDYYAAYNDSRKSQPIVDIMEVNPTLSLGFGLINRVDMIIGLGWDYQDRWDASYLGWQDSLVRFSFAVLKEAPYIPALKFSVGEVFPTGKYKNLDPDKAEVQGLGSGTYKTTFGIGLSKVIWWWFLHPIQFRMSLNYGLTTKVKVKNFNSYGGGYGTDGKIDPGSYFKGSIAVELSVSQKVVWALDLAYECDSKKTFKGINGTYADGTLALNGSPSGDVLSLAPAIEYNFTPNIALIGGVWFTVWGRNKLDFVAGIINFSYGF